MTPPIPTVQTRPPQPPNQIPSFGERIQKPGISKQIFFVLCGSLFFFNLGTDWTVRENERWAEYARLPIWPSFFWDVGNAEELRKIRMRSLDSETLQWMKKGLEDFKVKISSWPPALQNLLIAPVIYAAQTYLDSSEGRRFCWQIVGLNVLVYMMWKVPRLRGFMNRAFTHDPLSGRSYTLLTSMFSHKSFVHLCFNSLALTSFGSTVAYFLPRTPTGGDLSGGGQFLFFYISAGLFSGLISHVVSARILYPQMISQINALASLRSSSAASALIGNVAQQPVREILPSLGASGAIYATMVLTGLTYPDVNVHLFMLPVDIPIKVGLGGLVLMDTFGALRGWRLFDHYAHLGGAAFGALYLAYGKDLWHQMVKVTQDVRSKAQRRKKAEEKRESRSSS